MLAQSPAKPRHARLSSRQAQDLLARAYEQCLRELLAAPPPLGGLWLSENELVTRLRIPLSVARKLLDRLACEGVLERVRGRGNLLRRLPGTPTPAQTVVLLLPAGLARDHSPWLSELLGHGEQALASFGARLRPQVIEALTPELADGLAEYPALVLTANWRPSPAEQATLVAWAKRWPRLLQVGRALPALPSVTFDERQAGAEAARHLLRLGHRQLSFAAYDGIFWHAEQAERLAGVRQALAEAGAPPPLTNAPWPLAPPIPGEYHLAAPEAVAACLRTWRAAGVTGVVCANDRLTLSLSELARGLGWQVPGDWSLIGFDDAHVWRPRGLSTLRYPWDELGRRAARLLLGIDAWPAGEACRVAAQLIPRQSTAAPGHSLAQGGHS